MAKRRMMVQIMPRVIFTFPSTISMEMASGHVRMAVSRGRVKILGEPTSLHVPRRKSKTTQLHCQDKVKYVLRSTMRYHRCQERSLFGGDPGHGGGMINSTGCIREAKRD